MCSFVHGGMWLVSERSSARLLMVGPIVSSICILCFVISNDSFLLLRSSCGLATVVQLGMVQEAHSALNEVRNDNAPVSRVATQLNSNTHSLGHLSCSFTLPSGS